LEDYSIYLTRYKNEYSFHSFSPIASIDNIYYITSLTVFYTRTCITSILLVFKNGEKKSIGNDQSGTTASYLDLSGNKRLYSFKSVCDLFCDSFIICSIDTLTQKQECITSGFNYTLEKYRSVSLEPLEIYSFFATVTYFDTDVCISTLGVSYDTLWPTASLNSMDLFRFTTEKSQKNFTQSTTLNNGANNLVSLIVNYDDVCMTGLSFFYENGENFNVGYNGTSSFEINYLSSFSFESRCEPEEDTCYFIRICSFNQCYDIGDRKRQNGRKKITGLFYNFIIQSFYGELSVYSGHNCIQYLGVGYSFGKRFKLRIFIFNLAYF
jgi:hypothetical protein